MAVAFNESFVCGFFGLWRTYGAVARIETDSPGALKRDWLQSLDCIREWRNHRGSRATSITFFFVVPDSIADETRSFIGDILIAPRETPKELTGLMIDAVVSDPDGCVSFDSTIWPS